MKLHDRSRGRIALSDDFWWASLSLVITVIIIYLNLTMKIFDLVAAPSRPWVYLKLPFAPILQIHIKKLKARLVNNFKSLHTVSFRFDAVQYSHQQRTV